MTIPAALVAAGVLLAAGPVALAQQGQTAPGAATSEPAQTGKQTGQTTEQFVEKAASDGLMEVRLGQLAQEKGSSEAVKQFGQWMVQDHGHANDELMRLAAQKGITPPTELKPEHQKMIDKLQGLSGQEFDDAYAKAMVKDHTKAVKTFEQQSQSGTDPDIQAFAEKYLPVLRNHLQSAQQLSGEQVSKSR